MNPTIEKIANVASRIIFGEPALLIVRVPELPFVAPEKKARHPNAIHAMTLFRNRRNAARYLRATRSARRRGIDLIRDRAPVKRGVKATA